MTGRPATLWLKCGRCADTPNLATVTSSLRPRPVKAPALPGDDLVVVQRRYGRYTPYQRKGSPDEWVHKLGCKLCGYEEKISGERLAAWWAEFTATCRARDVRYLGRDR